jgi:hypothetical protein
LYPSKHNSIRYRDGGRCFEDLKQYAAVAFEPTDDAYDLSSWFILLDTGCKRTCLQHKYSWM